VSYERQRPVAEQTYLQDALEAMLSGEEVALSEVPAEGCLVNFPGRRKREHTVAERIQQTNGWPTSELTIRRESMQGGVITFTVTRASDRAPEGGTQASLPEAVQVRVDAATGQVLSAPNAPTP